MCGISGYLGSRSLADDRLEACQALMRRRGPDAENLVTLRTRSGRHLHLLHSRLSIIDLDRRADQPLSVGGSVLSYNGEVYNYLELRAALEKEGEIFSTSSDTEVLARQLARNGIDGIRACEGMWGFSWYDESTGSFYLCRDRFGEKPLYVYQDGKDIYFGSEPKFIFALLGRVLPVNQQHLRRYLVNGYKSIYKSRETFFEGLHEVAAGAYIECDDSGTKPETYFWRPEFDTEQIDMSYDEAVAGARATLIRSVELRLRSDVPIAFCLSGGVDSNALISIAKRQLGHDVHGFTIMNTDSRYEERDMVETAIGDLGLRHTPVPVSTEDFLPNLRTLVRYHDAPVYTITYYAQWRLMEAIREAGYKVSVSGTAADELFSGYFDHHNAYLAAMQIENGDLHQQALENWHSTIAPIVRNPFLQDPDYFVKYPNSREHIYLDAALFGSYLTQPFEETFHEVGYTSSLLRNRMANELFHESVPVILHEDDLNSMYFSIENRSPFLDTDLFDWCQKIPTRHLVKNGRAKAVLRDAVRGLAPDAILDNPRKVGFNAPMHSYLDTGSEQVRGELLADSPIFDVVRRDRISELLELDELPNSRSKFLFNFVCAKMFLEECAA